MRSVKIKSNHWKDPHDESSTDRALKNQTVNTNRLMGMWQETNDTFMIRDTNHTEKVADAMEIKEGDINEKGHDTIMHEGISNYGQTKVGSTYINGKR